MASYFDESERRVDAGTMSFRAEMRSYRVSSAMKEDSDSRSDSKGEVSGFVGGGWCVGIEGCRGRTGVCVPFVLVVRALLFADELLVHDFFELDHCGGGIWVFVGAFEGCLSDGCEAGAMRVW